MCQNHETNTILKCMKMFVESKLKKSKDKQCACHQLLVLVHPSPIDCRHGNALRLLQHHTNHHHHHHPVWAPRDLLPPQVFGLCLADLIDSLAHWGSLCGSLWETGACPPPLLHHIQVELLSPHPPKASLAATCKINFHCVFTKRSYRAKGEKELLRFYCPTVVRWETFAV